MKRGGQRDAYVLSGDGGRSQAAEVPSYHVVWAWAGGGVDETRGRWKVGSGQWAVGGEDT